MKNIGILNGPNLNRLGTREPGVYGSKTLADLESWLRSQIPSREATLEFYQSNHEGALIDKLHGWADAGMHGLVFNPGAFTHTSLALQDALRSVSLPCVEVHISNIHAREPIRQHSLTASACVGLISGLGFSGYLAAVRYFLEDGLR